MLQRREVSFCAASDEYTSSKYESNPDISYLFLSASSIFPFHELRSAALGRVSESQPQEPNMLKAYEDNLRRRIAAQPDTLILEE